MPNVKEFLYQELFSTSAEAMELFARSMGKAVKFDAFGGRTVFNAIVLSKPVVLAYADIHAASGAHYGGGTISKFAFKARIIDDPSPHGYLPDPCAKSISDDPGKQLRRTFLHTTFLSSNDYAVSMNTLPNVGDFVKVELTKNEFSYDMSYGKFLKVTNSNNGVPPGLTSDACSAIDSLFGSEENIYAHTAKVPAGTLDFSGAELKKLVPLAMPLLQLIGKAESGGYGFNAVNNGTKPPSGVLKSGTSHGLWDPKGKPPSRGAGLPKITDMDVATLRSYMYSGGPATGYKCTPKQGCSGTGAVPQWGKDRLFATGFYQVIPATSQYYAHFLGVKAKLTEENQHIVGLGLAIVKRPTLGKYLFGKTASEAAALDNLAMEWASFPIYTAGGDNGKCKKGQSYYCGDGVNKSHHDLNDVLTTLRSTKKAIADSPDAQTVLTANKSLQKIK